MEKTQLKELVNGRNAIHGFTEKDKQIGSSYADRQSLFERILKENPNGLDLDCAGVKIHLSEVKSKSGKTTQWFAELQESDAIKILGFNPSHSYQIRYEMVISQDLYIEIWWFTRKSDSTNWKTSGCLYPNPQKITIL